MRAQNSSTCSGVTESNREGVGARATRPNVESHWQRLWNVGKSFYAYTEVARRTRWSTEALTDFQQIRLGQALTFASRSVRFHRERCPRDPLDLTTWPLSSRQQLKSLPLSQLLADGIAVDDCYAITTSGTTGEPLRIYFTAADLRQRRLYFERMFRAYGLPMFCRLVQVGCYPTSKLYDAGSRWNPDRRSLLSVYAPIDSRLDLLATANPQAIMGHTNHLAEMATRAWERGMQFPELQVVIGVGELMDATKRSLIARGLSATVHDSYGAVEAGNIAFECPSSVGTYHIHADNLFVEILQNGVPAQPGTVGQVTCTPLNYRAMPLVRYQLGDLAAFGEVCPCGSGLPTLKHLNGREEEMITLSSGRRLSSQALSCAFSALEGVRRYQIQQHRRGVFTLVVDSPDPEMACCAADRVRALLDVDDQLAVDRHALPLSAERKERVIVVEGE